MFVGIVSPNYSGSTVVGGILHRFSGVQHVGELWKIFRDDRSKAVCQECKPKRCEFFNSEYFDELIDLNPSDRLESLMQRFDANIIISGDKGPRYFTKHGICLDKALILVKNKYSAAHSYAKRLPDYRTASSQEKIELVKQGTKEYFDTWQERVKWIQENLDPENYCFASPDIISEASDELLVKLSQRLFGKALPLHESPFDERFHYIGGNHKVSVGHDRSFFGGEFKADKRYESDFTDEMYEAIDEYVEHNVNMPNVLRDDHVFLEDWFLKSVD